MRSQSRYLVDTVSRIAPPLVHIWFLKIEIDTYDFEVKKYPKWPTGRSLRKICISPWPINSGQLYNTIMKVFDQLWDLGHPYPIKSNSKNLTFPVSGAPRPQIYGGMFDIMEISEQLWMVMRYSR